MTIEDQIRDEKIQYDINRETAKIFTYFPLGKSFEKQTKTIKDQGEKQADALKASKPKELKLKETNHRKIKYTTKY